MRKSMTIYFSTLFPKVILFDYRIEPTVKQEITLKEAKDIVFKAVLQEYLVYGKILETDAQIDIVHRDEFKHLTSVAVEATTNATTDIEVVHKDKS